MLISGSLVLSCTYRLGYDTFSLYYLLTSSAQKHGTGSTQERKMTTGSTQHSKGEVTDRLCQMQDSPALLMLSAFHLRRQTCSEGKQYRVRLRVGIIDQGFLTLVLVICLSFSEDHFRNLNFYSCFTILEHVESL